MRMRAVPMAFFLFAFLLFPFPSPAATWYVRTDGGPPDRCTGLADAAAPPSGTGLPCAWDHPFRALPPGGPARIAGGDTLQIGPGSYMIGFGAPGADTSPGACTEEWTWDCGLGPLPSGPDAGHPTRLLGAGALTGCGSPPELWGTERANRVIDLTSTSNAEIACLVVTDHSGCVEGHTGSLACVRDTYPHGPWAASGIYAQDSASVTLRDLNVHGLASRGILAGRLTDWTVERVRIAGNGGAGWDGDIDGTDSNGGTLLFRNVTVEWNGCGETWPEGQPSGCWGQSAGGYGDGVATGETAGNWVFEDSLIRWNTQDGIDLLYARLGSTIAVRRTRAEGNAGNQIKTNGPATLENVVAVGNCGFFTGKPFTLDVDECRAVGNTLSLALRGGDLVTVTNSTITGQGDCLLIAGCDTDHSACNGSERVRTRNDLFAGGPDLTQQGDRTCLMYQETFPQGDAVFDADYLVVSDVKDDACPGMHHSCGVPPGLVNGSISSFDGHLVASSPAVNAGTATGAPATDFEGTPRDGAPDVGAYEFRATGLSFYAVTPCRLVDTRGADGPALEPSGAPDRTFTLTGGPCGVPAEARSLSVNVTVTQPAGDGNLVLYPAEHSPPVTSIVSFVTGRTRASKSLLLLSGDGAAKARNRSAGTVHLIVDVNGYFR